MKKSIPSQEDINKKGSGAKAVKGNAPRNRPKRKPIAGRDRLTAPPREGYRRRFVTDVGDRVQRYKDAGYEVVTDPTKTGDHSAGDATQLGSAVTAEGGGGRRMVLMEQREEWYNEDQAAKQEQIDDQERAMFEQMNEPGRYGKVTLQRGERRQPGR